MRERESWRAALSMVLAASGVGLASGREIVLFFAQFGNMAWLGVLTAAACFGLLMAGLAWRGRSAPGHDGGLAAACEALRLAAAALTAAFMLTRLGDMGALALPLRHSYAFGAGFGALMALGLYAMRRKWLVGAALLIFLCGFYAACAADARPVRLYEAGYTEFPLSGSAQAAAAFAALYAAMNACAAAWGLGPETLGGLRPLRLGAKAAALLAPPLILANGALLRGGSAVQALRLPWVALAARWGLAGFWLCVALQTLCATATLSAAIGALLRRLRAPRAERPLAAFMLLGMLIVFAVLSYHRTC